MNSSFRDEGYAATLSEEPFGAFLTILKHGAVIGQIAVGIVHGGPHALATIEIKRFVRHELEHVSTTDEFSDGPTT